MTITIPENYATNNAMLDLLGHPVKPTPKQWPDAIYVLVSHKLLDADVLRQWFIDRGLSFGNDALTPATFVVDVNYRAGAIINGGLWFVLHRSAIETALLFKLTFGGKQ